MLILRPIFAVLLLVLCAIASPASALEVNYWPFFTGEKEAGTEEYTRWQAIGPIVFEKETATHHIAGVRPFFIRLEEKGRSRVDRHVLYPLFNHRKTPQGTRWDVLSLLSFDRFSPEEEEATSRFHLFPFIFFQSHPDPERNYFGIFPLAGETQNFFGYDRVRWFFFPFNVRLERKDVVTVGMPWPFIRFVKGDETSGFHLWPLYGREVREGQSTRQYFLWPLGYRVRSDLHKEQPFEAHGFIPFYTASRSEDAVSRTFVWPFFGYTTSHSPQYDEVRYFWPLFVQRRGEAHYTNRWAPFYTHSIRLGVDKKWYAWPFVRRETWIERDLLHRKSQFLYFLFWSLEQWRPGDPHGPRALKNHVWPLFSRWDDGAGRRQFQLFSPFEVFAPYNEAVRENWSPLFAIYRYDRQPERVRHSILFDFITWTRKTENTRLEIGPLASYERAENGRRVEVLKGLLTVGSHREGARPFRILWLPREKDDSEERD